MVYSKKSYIFALLNQTKQTRIMKVTKEFLSQKHREYNQQYFGGMLPSVFFLIKKTKKTLGFYRGRNFGMCEIMISTYYDRSEHDVCRTLLHEMIHQYIHVKDLKDTSPHGKYFKHYAHMLNQYGWNITARERLPQDIQTSEVHTYNVIRIKQASNYFIFVVSSANFNDYKIQLTKRYGDKLSYFVTTNPIFSKFPQCRSRIRGRVIMEHELSNYR